MFYAKRFECKPHEKVLEVEHPECQVPGGDFGKALDERNCVVVFYHVEPDDEERVKNVVTKLVKNIKWIAGKFGTRTVVLHSFNHLSARKGSPELARIIISRAIDKLKNVGYSVSESPFGYQNEWIMHVAGESLAKVFKEL